MICVGYNPDISMLVQIRRCDDWREMFKAKIKISNSYCFQHTVY